MPAANDSRFTALLLQFEEVGTDDKPLRARQVLFAREDAEKHLRSRPAGIAQGERVLVEAVASSAALRRRHSSFQDLEIRGVPNHALVPERSVAPELDPDRFRSAGGRSEERRVGKECPSLCRFRWSPYHEKKNNRNVFDFTLVPSWKFSNFSTALL